MPEKNSLQVEAELSPNAQILSHTSLTYAKTIEDATKIGFCLPMVWTNSQKNIISMCDRISI